MDPSRVQIAISLCLWHLHDIRQIFRCEPQNFWESLHPTVECTLLMPTTLRPLERRVTAALFADAVAVGDAAAGGLVSTADRLTEGCRAVLYIYVVTARRRDG